MRDARHNQQQAHSSRVDYPLTWRQRRQQFFIERGSSRSSDGDVRRLLQIGRHCFFVCVFVQPELRMNVVCWSFVCVRCQ